MKKIAIISCLVSSILLADGMDSFELERDFINLTPKEQKDLVIAQKWVNANTTSIAGKDGSVVYLYGESMPSIVTAPLRLTNITLEAGEIIKDVQIGDSVRWVVSLSLSGEEPNLTSHVVLKPVDKNLQTTLSIMTNKRVYTLNLVSEAKRFMPNVSFHYTDNIVNSLESYKNALKQKSKNKEFTKVDEEIPSNIENIDFGYSITGDADFKPLRVYNDGIKTYLQMPKNMKFYEAPALMVLDTKTDENQIVNYRLKKDTFIVDRLFDKAVLISNVGQKQSKITITKKSSKINQEIVDNVLYDLSLAKEEVQ